MQTFDKLHLEVKTARSSGSGWLELAKRYGVSAPTIRRVAQGIEPIESDIRAALGLPQVCKYCGRIYRERRRAALRWRDIPPDLLLWALNHREPINNVQS